jgi:hypothetical protein
MPWFLNARRLRLRLAAGIVSGVLAALPLAVKAAQDPQILPPVQEGGVKIRGHWVIEVRDPDGSLVAQREFDNSLTQAGRLVLGLLLNREASLGRWIVGLASTAPTSLCAPAPACYIVDTTATEKPSGTGVFSTLTSRLAPSGTEVVLTGSFTAPAGGPIDSVATYQTICIPSIATVDCKKADTAYNFTAHDLRDAQGAAAPVFVGTGQIVQVTVTIGFCSYIGCQS